LRGLGALLVALSGACASTPELGPAHPQARILKNWALSRCLAKAAGESPPGDDAARSAAAYLEMGTGPIESYDKLEALADTYLQRKYGGSVNGEYNTMKCIDLYESRELETLVKELSAGDGQRED
jgi:Type VI secretion system (T6SS), amidase immunity protein